MKDNCLSAGKAAEHLGMSYKQFRRIFNQIPHYTSPKGWRYYYQSDLDRWKDSVRKVVAPLPPKKKGRGLINISDCPKW
jgi:hypothetical protein